jgi:hypothetical protein
MNSKAYKYLIPNVILSLISIMVGIFVPDTRAENATISFLTSIWMILAALTYDVLNMPYEYQEDKEFFEKISRPDGFKSIIERVTTQIDTIWNDRHNNFGLLFQQSMEEIETCGIKIKTIHSHGIINLEGDSPLAKTTECFKKAKTSVFATSYANDISNAAWQSTRMQSYLEANREAVERGVKVSRVFIFESKQQIQNEEFKKVLRIQLGMKTTEKKRLNVFIIHENHIFLSESKSEKVPDFSFYDDILVSTWLSWDSTKLDKSKIEFNEPARREARRIRDHLLASNRAQLIKSVDEIDRIIEDWPD